MQSREHVQGTSPGAPLPEVNEDSIGDAFDEAMAIGEASLLAAGPDGSSLADWLRAEGPISELEAAGLLGDRVEELYEDGDWVRQLSCRLREAEPRCWVVPQVLDEGSGPGSMQDSSGWDEVAETVMQYCERRLVKRVAAEVMTALSSTASPSDRVVEVLKADVTRPVRHDKPGFWDGHHFTTYVDTVKELKRSDRLNEAQNLLIHLVEATEAEDRGGRVGLDS